MRHMTTLLGPVVHLNGTARDDLMEGYQAAMAAVRLARKALQATYPHGRDYPNGGLLDASEAHGYRLAHLNDMERELEALAIYVCDQPGQRA